MYYTDCGMPCRCGEPEGVFRTIALVFDMLQDYDLRSIVTSCSYFVLVASNQHFKLVSCFPPAVGDFHAYHINLRERSDTLQRSIWGTAANFDAQVLKPEYSCSFASALGTALSIPDYLLVALAAALGSIISCTIQVNNLD